MQCPTVRAGNCPGRPKADRGSLPASVSGASVMSQCVLGRSLLGRCLLDRRVLGQCCRVSPRGSAPPGQVARNQVLLNPPEPLIALVESLSAPLLLIMMIWVGFCVPSDVPLAAATL